MEMEPVLKAYITNLGKYNEGELAGRWHAFPTTKEEIQQTFAAIGIDGKRYEEFFITDYETTVEGLYVHLPEYAKMGELNYLANKLENLGNSELAVYEAAVAMGDYCGSIQDLINLTENLDCFDYMDGIHEDEELGYYYVEEAGIYDMNAMGSLRNYIDYESFGRDVRLEEGGQYVGSGYIRDTGDRFWEEYDGMDVPEEYKVFAYPKPERNKKVQKNLDLER